MIRSICLLGFGEVGQTLAEDLPSFHMTAWDVLFSDPASKPSKALASYSVTQGKSAEAAVAEADLVVSAVTAAQDATAAKAVAGGFAQGRFLPRFQFRFARDEEAVRRVHQRRRRALCRGGG